MKLDRDDILHWLREDDEDRLAELWLAANQVRAEYVGDAVHLRGLVEVSNFCQRRCRYCGIRAGNRHLARYRMDADEVLQVAAEAVRRGYGTVVFQAGEDAMLTTDWLCPLVRRIKSETPLAVTLSLGERTESELAAFRDAGADRYLLRFETSNGPLLDRIHPPKRGDTNSDRIGLLRTMRELGYETGSGVMVGIPGQTYADLARDLEVLAELDIDMIGIGPYIPHPRTPLARLAGHVRSASEDQPPADEMTTYKMVALARLICPRSNIPCTSALATLNAGDARVAALNRGANVIMPNLTPAKYRRNYEIYPNKAGTDQTSEENDAAIRRHIAAAGRSVGVGRGDSPNLMTRQAVFT